VSLVETVLRRIRDQDWGYIFAGLILIVFPSGMIVFFLRDRYYRRRGAECVPLTLKGD
jgi:ABC-type glycerol-3-phosphate transport system permease component